MEKNAKFYFKKHGGYDNMFLDIELDNGDVISMQVKPCFFNAKLVYKLKKHVVSEKNGK